jgi:peptidyl-tRNA hydrolase, PTH1 family
MKVVVGLGNPGRRYQNTRHNVGFEALAELARRHNASKPTTQFEAEVAEIFVGGVKVLLLAPQTYMNLSGRSVSRCVRFYQLTLDNLLIVCDDMNLPFGCLRFRASGSAGGQKGLNDTIAMLGTKEFSRLRIGIGRSPDFMDARDYVLSRFNKTERRTMEDTLVNAANGIETWVQDSIDAAMNQYN